ncbi:MAG: ATP-binding protein [Chromatiales bacterium]|nr:ATP-binding protein [Chromatiales bacterium]
MARLFITLYGILFITGALFVLGLVWLPEMALKGTIRDYYERSMFGVFGLVEDRLSSQPQSEWPQTVKQLKGHFKSGLALLDYDQLPLDDGDLAALELGKFVFTDDDDLTRFYKRIPDSDRYLMLAMGKTREQREVEEVEGIVQLIGELFMQRDREEWPQILQALRKRFQMPLELLPLDDPSLPADRLADIEAGKVVVLGLKESRETYYARVHDSELVFRAGPYEAPFVLRNFNTILLILFALLVALAVYLWVRPVWRELSRFDQGVTRLGAGDLNTRLIVSNGAALKPLAETFNGMARRIQKLIQSHRELTGAVSHELRTPIARLRFRIDMLEDPLGEEDRKRHIIAMRKDILELEELVSESLSYSRLDRERPELLMDTVYLKDWLQALLIETEDDYNGVKPELVTEGFDSQLQVSVDSKLMGRAVKNLLRNGQRHARQRLIVSADCRQGQAIILVEDDGSGVPEQERHRIFEPFARLDTARDRESGGVGLGLAIVRQVARWHGGQAWVEEAASGGARFMISWPLSHD